MKIALALLLLPFLATASPQTTPSVSDFIVTTWRSEDGLPHDNVNCITQTHDGYLWIGTPMGLARFDGAKFETFSAKELPELGVNRITDIYEDRDDVLWVALENGRLLAWKNGVMSLSPAEEGKCQAITKIAQDANGYLWLRTAAGTLRAVPASITNDQPAIAIAPDTNAPVFSIASDDSRQLWAGTKTGLKAVNNGELRTPEGLAALNDAAIGLVIRGQQNSIWAIHGRKLWQISAGKIITEIEILEEFGQIQTVLEAADNQLWISTTSGKLLCREKSGRIRSLGQEDGLRGIASVLFEDHEGDIWCASYGGGLSRIRPRLFRWHKLTQANIVSPYTFNVCSDSAGNVWARLGAQTLIKISPNSNAPVPWMKSTVPDSIRALFCDRKGVLWLGAEGGKLYRMNGDTIEFVLEVGDKVSFISAIFEDSRSNLWVGFTGGGGVGRMRGGDPRQWEELKEFPVKDVRSIAETSDGAIWFGTYYGGATRYQGGRYTQYTMREGLPADYVRCLYADKNGSLWMGTLRGLCRWQNGKLSAITVKDGLWNDSISDLLEDGSGNFWISSFGGVFRAARQQLNDFADGRISSVQCIGYNRNDGLPGLECPGGFQPAGTRTPDGRIWFPTEAGLVSVDADRIGKNEQSPPVLIEQISVEGESRPVRNNTGYEKIAPGKRHLEFRFAALSFASPEKIRFRHKLEGLESEWSSPDDHRSVTYNFVPPGKYVFRVIACNNDGVWNPVGAALPIVLQPFFWQTAWFRAGTVLAIGAALFFAVRHMERKKLKLRLERIERQQAIERDRARIAKDIHDDAGATLAQIALLSERIENCQRLEEVGILNKRIETAARQTIQSIDEIVWAVSPKHDTLESLANYLSSFAQEHLELAGVRCVLDVAPILAPLTVRAEIRHNILLTAREALQNVVNHAAATEVCMSLDFRQNVLAIRISDNGNGFEIEKRTGAGNGISNMRKRLDEIHGTLEITSSPGGGTTVEFSVVIEKLHVSGIGNSPSRG
ncbi:MAG: hypothetical protein JWQ71_3557 [Pedosphaera sp.]|nr:hypothetical protein [Pedosphaera sp.]